MDLPRDKHDVVQELNLPGYHAERYLEQRGDWVLLATQPQAERAEGVPVMEYEDRVVMQRYVSKEAAKNLAPLNSAMRVMGGWILNLRTGETVRVNPVNIDQHV